MLSNPGALARQGRVGCLHKCMTFLAIAKTPWARLWNPSMGELLLIVAIEGTLETAQGMVRPGDAAIVVGHGRVDQLVKVVEKGEKGRTLLMLVGLCRPGLGQGKIATLMSGKEVAVKAVASPLGILTSPEACSR